MDRNSTIDAGTVSGLDRADAEWRAFLVAWRRILGEQVVTARELRQSADSAGREWAGTFPTTVRGGLPSPKSLGRILTGRVDHPVGDLVARSVRDPHDHARVYWVDLAHRPPPHAINRLASDPANGRRGRSSADPSGEAVRDVSTEVS
jgi:hypothetical protein